MAYPLPCPFTPAPALPGLLATPSFTPPSVSPPSLTSPTPPPETPGLDREGPLGGRPLSRDVTEKRVSECVRDLSECFNGRHRRGVSGKGRGGAEGGVRKGRK